MVRMFHLGELMEIKFPSTKKVVSALKEYAATDLTATSPYEFDGEIPCRGEQLSPIIWQGRQWAVTEYGIECRDGTYAITKERLWEEEKTWGWIQHLSDKTWVDLTDFAEALRIARGRHG